MPRLALFLPLAGCWLSQDVIDGRKAALPTPDTDVAVDDDTDTPTDASDPPADDTDAPPDSDTPPLPTCADHEIPPGQAEVTAGGSTVGATDDHAASCLGFTGGADLVWSWQAPADGCYVFSTAGSDFDTVLYLLDDCGPELMCNDDALSEGGRLDSEVHAELAAEARVSIVVDGYDGDAAGDATLTVRPGERLTPDEVSRATSSVLHTGSTRGYDTTIRFEEVDGCPSGSGARDVLVEWTTPLAGHWRFWIERPDFDAILSVHRICDPAPLVCGDAPPAQPGQPTQPDEVLLTLDAGETIILRVAGHAQLVGPALTGTFELHGEASRDL
ncbi:MAG TPA: hypothetical protein PKA64_05000 [Myxococcota bacterium]|nr:hypothetical protein [Myxococcota bacterium]